MPPSDRDRAAVLDPRPTAVPRDAVADGAARRARRARRRVTIELSLVVVLLALIPLSRWIDATVPSWLPAVQAVSAVPVPPAVLVLGAAWWSGRRAVAAAAAVVVIMHMAPLVPWWITGDHVVDAAGADPFVVMAANLQYALGDADAVAAAVDDHDVDVLLLLEATRDAVAAFRAQGIEERLPHTIADPREDAGGVFVLSRYPLATDDVPTVPPQVYTTPAVRVQAPHEVLVLAAHPVPPWPLHTAGWHREVRALAVWADDVPAVTLLVMAGDFNAGHAHPVFRRFHAAGLRDAHRQIGAGPVATWPRTGRTGLTLPAMVHLDHVLFRGMDVADAGTVRIPRSDHDAVWAALVPHGGVTRPDVTAAG